MAYTVHIETRVFIYDTYQEAQRAARQCPECLGFPVCVIGSRTKIPRVPFIRFVEGET